MSLSTNIGDAPGSVRARRDVVSPLAYAVFDCETTGTIPSSDEIVSLAVVRLDAAGFETARFARLVRPSKPIPAETTAVHRIGDEDVASAPSFGDIAPDLLEVLARAVFVAHNVPFDLVLLQHSFARAGVEYAPVGVACTLDAFRLLEPLADNHRLQSICERRGIVLADSHRALDDALATADLLRVLLAEGIAPETVKLDHEAFLRLRSRGDSRPATERQIRRVFGMAASAGLLDPEGGVDRAQIVALIERASGNTDIDSLTRQQVQDVYDVLEKLIETPPVKRAA